MYISLSALLEAIVLTLALSVDTFIACFAYGNQKINIPRTSVAVIGGICSGALCLAMLLGSLIAPVLTENAARLISFAILLIIGLIRLFDSSIKARIRKGQKVGRELKFTVFNLNFILSVYADPEIADADASRSLSMREALSLSAALSLDGIAVGVGAGIARASIVSVASFSLLFTVAAVVLGHMAGRKVAEKSGRDFSWLGGALLIACAVWKLV